MTEIREQVGDPRSGPGARSHRVTIEGSVSVEVLPERGLDLGSLWFGGVPLAWRSPLGTRSASIDPDSSGWAGRFVGGILVTCGLDHVGAATEDFGLHGSHHLTPATDVSVRRTPQGGVVIEGTVDSARNFDRNVVLTRQIIVSRDAPQIVVRDVVENKGVAPTPAPVLYHLNFGAPFVMPGSAVEIDAEHQGPFPSVDWGSWDLVPPVQDDPTSAVWEHVRLRTSSDGRARVRVRSGATPLVVAVEWSVAELGKCVQWVNPTRGAYVVALEPTNLPVRPPDGSDPAAPLLAAGARQEHGFTLSVTTSTARTG